MSCSSASRTVLRYEYRASHSVRVGVAEKVSVWNFGASMRLPRRPVNVSIMVFSHSGVPAGMPGFLMRIVSAMPVINDGSTTMPSLMVPVPDRLAWLEFALVAAVPW